jgi:MoaA/NifB/PqqE/SkfB family radical SAM enzyme
MLDIEWTDPMLTFKHLQALQRNELPGQLVIQMTDKCNGLCPQCGMRRTEPFPRSKLSTDEIKRILDAAAEKGMEAVSFTGGEPLLFLDELLMLMKYAGSIGIQYIRTGTNGFLFAHSSSSNFETKVGRIAEKMAETPVRNFWISVDSVLPSVHEEMRGFPGVIRGIEKALPIFHEHGIYPSANLGLNRNVGGDRTRKLQRKKYPKDVDYLDDFYREFRTAFQEFYRFVAELGFTMVNTCYPMSVDDYGDSADLKAVYAATSVDDVVKFNPAEKSLLFKALLETIPQFRSKMRIFSPRCSLYALYKQYNNHPGFPYPCRGGIDFFYIDSKDGNTYPCGYRGNENFGKLWDMDLEQVDRNGACYRCDWECFRDPSELFGPLLQVLSSPFQLLKKLNRDRPFFRLWVDDLKYYQACDLFDGRRPPDYRRLRHF